MGDIGELSVISHIPVASNEEQRTIVREALEISKENRRRKKRKRRVIYLSPSSYFLLLL
jgi:hypothetical protein